MFKHLLIICFAIIVSGCVSSSLYNAKSDEKLTVAKVQKNIKVGMSSAEVVEVLGSPNIISSDELRREVWVYDKISTQSAYQNSGGGISIILAGAGANGGSSVKSTRTLTIIVKFDQNQKVRDVSYHSLVSKG